MIFYLSLISFYNLVTDSLISSGAKLKQDSHRKNDNFCWWWGNDYAKLTDEKSEAYKAWKYNLSVDNLIIIENKSKLIRKKLKNLKHSKFKNLSSSLNKNSNISDV